MKLIRYGQPGAERPGLIDAHGTLRDLSMLLPDTGPAQLAPRTLAVLAALVLTGTPAGVGLGCKPAPRFLRAGDVMRLGAAGLGEQRLACVGG